MATAAGPTRLVRGRAIELPGGAPVAGAGCEARDVGGSRMTGCQDVMTAADGTFQFSLDPGPTSIRCGAPLFVYAAEDLDVERQPPRP